MPVTPSTLIPIETLAEPQEVWDVLSLFNHNWIREMTVRTSWSTDITSARSDAEKRFGITGKPYRTMTALITAAKSRQQMRLIDNIITRMASARSLWPLYSDLARITSTSGLDVFCDTTNKRFYAGARVLLADVGSEVQMDSQKAVKIASVAANKVTLDPSETVPSFLAAAITDKTAFIFPLIETELELDHDMPLMSNQTGEQEITAFEMVGKSALPAAESYNVVPSGFQSFESLPILDMSGDWDRIRVGRVRSGARSNLGIGFSFELFGARPRATAMSTFKGMSRSASWDLIKLFDSRRGRLLPFWMIRPEDSLRITSFPSTTQVAVEAVGAELDWDNYTHIYIKLNDGTLYLRAISSVLRAGDTDTLTVAAISPLLSVSSVSAAGFACKARFASDEITERWITDSHVALEFNTVEVLEEKTVTISMV